MKTSFTPKLTYIHSSTATFQRLHNLYNRISFSYSLTLIITLSQKLSNTISLSHNLSRTYLLIRSHLPIFKDTPLSRSTTHTLSLKLSDTVTLTYASIYTLTFSHSHNCINISMIKGSLSHTHTHKTTPPRNTTTRTLT